jgi:hypothetical protein
LFLQLVPNLSVDALRGASASTFFETVKFNCSSYQTGRG